MKNQLIALLTALSLIMPSAAALAAPTQEYGTGEISEDIYVVSENDEISSELPEHEEAIAENAELSSRTEQNGAEVFEMPTLFGGEQPNDAEFELLSVTASGTCGSNLTWALDDSGTLTISGTGAMGRYSESMGYYAPWKDYRSEIKELIIEEGATSIGVSSFVACSNLKKVTLPSTLESIGASAFYECTSLLEITIPSSVTEIGENAFYTCTSLESANIPYGITTIEQKAFNKCNLKQVCIPSTVQSINYASFRDCSNLESVIIMSTNLTIDSSAFSGSSAKLYSYSGSAAETFASENGYTFSAFTASGTCGDNLTWALDDSGTLIIDGTGAMTDWTYSSTAPWYDYVSSITEVVIGGGVTSIGDRAFYGYDGLTSVTIPDSVTNIGEYAFRRCRSLISVTIPNSVTSMENLAFSQCTGLTSVTIADGVTSIDNSAFQGCSGLTSVTIPESVTSIGYYAFGDCTGLTNITIPDSVTSIGYYAFGDCTGLTNITIPDSVTSIGNYAFRGCSGLTSVTIPSGVTSIGDGAFASCSGVEVINVPSDNLNYKSIDGVLFSKDETTLAQYPAGKSGLSYTIPDSVTSIGGSAFRGCSGLTSVTIPDSVTSIGVSVFSGCSGLTSVTIPNSVTSIGDSAFYNCYGLTSVIIPDSVTSIGDYVFKDCSGLTSVTIPNSVTSIGVQAFAGCTGLTSVTIPNSVTSIGDRVFNGCSGLTSVTIPNSVTSIGDDAFCYCSGLTSVTIPNGVTSIGNYAFYDCSGLTSVTIPDSVTSIGNYAFRYCTSLTDIYYSGTSAEWSAVTIGSSNDPLTNAAIHYTTASGTCGDNLTWILYDDGTLTIDGTGAMWDWGGDVPWYSYTSQINTVIIGGGVTSIGYGAFDGCSDLTSVTIPDSVTSIGDYAFYGCSRLTSVTIPDSVTSIGVYAFGYCYSLTSVTIPDSVTSISSDAFYYCSGLTSVTIPNSVTSIGERAFHGCSGLTSVTIPDSVTSIGFHAFGGCSGLTSVIIPDSVTSIGERAFNNCNSLTDVFYAGTADEWSAVTIGSYNEYLTGATIHYQCGACGDDAMWRFENGTLYIEGTGDMWDWSQKTDVPWYKYRYDYTSAVISDGITHIGKYSFGEARVMTSVTIPDSVTTIGNCAFQQALKLESFNISANITEIGSYAFMGMSSLKSITVDPGNARYMIIDGALVDTETNCILVYPILSGALSYTVPDSIQTIDRYGFYSTNISSIVIGSGVTRIRDYAFRFCSNLKTVLLPENVETVNKGVFSGCDNLRNVIIFNKNASLGEDIFADHISSFALIGYSGSTADTYAAENNIMFNAIIASGKCGDNLTWVLDDSGTLTIDGTGAMWDWSSYSSVPWYSYRSQINTVIMGGGVTSIGKFAFGECSGLTSVEIPESVTSIGDDAFYYCSGLTSVNISKYVTNIGVCPFYNCSALTDINVDAKNEYYCSMDGNLFNKDKTIIIQYSAGKEAKSYAIPNSVTSIGFGAFGWCNNLQSLIISNNVKYIDSHAFRFCTSITDVYYSGIEDEWNAITIEDFNETLTNATMHYAIASGACGDNLTWTITDDGTLTISGTGDMWDKPSNSTKRLDWYVYRTNVTSVVINNGVTGIGATAFNNFSNLTDIIIHGSITEIREHAFWGCTSLTDITIPDGVINIDEYVFEECGNLVNVTIPKSVTSIGRGIFLWCNSLENITVDSENQYYCSVDGNLFDKEKTNLIWHPSAKNDSSFTIPEGVTNIDYCAFHSCGSLESVIIPESVTNIEDAAFGYCDALTDVYYGGTEDEWSAITIDRDNECLTGATIHYDSAVLTPSPTVNPTPTASPTASPTATPSPTPTPTATPTATPSATPTPTYVSTPSPTPTPTPTPIPHSGTDGAVTWSVENGTLTITGTGAIPDYSAGGAPWYAIKGEISKIVIEQGIDTIGTNAFYDLSRVSEAALPSTVTQVNAGAFEGCTALGSIALPAGMNRGIGAGAFKNTGLTTITVPSGVTAIESGAFEGCISITEITLPFIGSQVGSKNNTDTFDYIFGGAVPASLRKVTITNETVVPANAFKDLANIENITINNGVTEIGNGAFDGCSSLKAFAIPSGIAEISDNTFRGCESAVTITVPDTVQAIGEAAFDGCKKLKSVNIPSGVTVISDYTFRNCESLTKIEIPVKVMNIGVGVLEGCKSLYSIKVPFVGVNADPDATEDESDGLFGYFFGCENGKIPAAVTKVEIIGTDRSNYIPKEAFKDCAYIEDIIIDGGRAILDNAFENCKNLKHLYIPKSISNIGSEILRNCTRIETLVVPFVGKNNQDKNSETSVLGGFFGYNDSNIAKGTMQYYDGVNYHYYNVPHTLKNVSVLNQTEIPTNAFSECDFIESVSIITGAIMNEEAFFHCASLKTVTLPNDLQTIGKLSFSGCESLETINIPTKVKTIGEQSFYNCRSLKNVTMPDSITEIADDVFNGTNMFADNSITNSGVITCSQDSTAYNYAVEKGIQTNVVPSEQLNVRKTATNVALLSDSSYLFDITDSYNMRGILHVELYADGDKLITERTRTADDVEYRIEFTAEEMVNVSYAKIYITAEDGTAVTSEDEIILYGDIPELPESDAAIEYDNGTVTFTGTSLKAGSVLLQAIYNGDKTLNRVNAYSVSGIDDEIEVDTDFEAGTVKLMLWSSLADMKPIASCIEK